MTPAARRILIVDDHPLCAMAVASVLAGGSRGIEVVSINALRELPKVASHGHFLLALLDLRLPDSIGLSAVERVRAALPGTPICIVSGQSDPVTMRQALALGVSGFLPKSLAFDELSRGIERVLAGETVFPRGIGEANDDGLLSAAEQRVMQALCTGLQNKQIAFELGLSESTIKSHLARIFDKLGVTNRSQAILAYELALDGQAHDGGAQNAAAGN